MAWCDDDLRDGRPAAVRARLALRGVDALLVVPNPRIGLTPDHVARLEAWAEAVR